MTSRNHDQELPKNWVKKESRSVSSRVYYFNLKTGETTWVHPSKEKRGEQKSSLRSKGEKKDGTEKDNGDRNTSPTLPKMYTGEERAKALNVALHAGGSTIGSKKKKKKKSAKKRKADADVDDLLKKIEDEITRQKDRERKKIPRVNSPSVEGHSSSSDKKEEKKMTLYVGSPKHDTTEQSNAHESNTSVRPKKEYKIAIKLKDPVGINKSNEIEPNNLRSQSVSDKKKTDVKENKGHNENVEGISCTSASVESNSSSSSEGKSCRQASGITEPSVSADKPSKKSVEIHETIRRLLNVTRRVKWSKASKEKKDLDLKKIEKKEAGEDVKTQDRKPCLVSSKQSLQASHNKTKVNSGTEYPAKFKKRNLQVSKRSAAISLRNKEKEQEDSSPIETVELFNEWSGKESFSPYKDEDCSHSIESVQPSDKRSRTCLVPYKVREYSPSHENFLDDYKVQEPNDTKEKQICEQADEDEVSDMEVEEQEVVIEVANFRGLRSPPASLENIQFLKKSISIDSQSLYFVVDTNVLIQDIGFLENLKFQKFFSKEIVIVIPYIALQEMDGLKKNASIGKASQDAISWCNKHLEANSLKVQGQSYDNYRKTVAENKGASADDLIRDCCLLMKEEGLDVCLLSNDINLRNKALMSAIKAVNMKTLQRQLNEQKYIKELLVSKPSMPDVVVPQSVTCSVSKYHSQVEDVLMTDVNIAIDSPVRQSISDSVKLKTPLICSINDDKHSGHLLSEPKIGEPKVPARTHSPKEVTRSKESILFGLICKSLCETLGNILEFVLKDAFGDLWTAIVLRKPPWTLRDVLICWKKHWIAVMIDKFPIEVKHLIENISDELPVYNKDKASVIKLKDKVKTLFKFFESEPYQKFVCALPEEPPVVLPKDLKVDISNDPGITSVTSEPSEEIINLHHSSSGLDNVQNMIRHVGVYITHFIALTLDAYGLEHNLPTLSSDKQMTHESAKASAVNLHKVIMKLGNLIVRCVREKTSELLIEFGHMLINFWADAKEPCPNLSFTEKDLAQFVSSPAGVEFLEMTVRELEKLINMLNAILKDQ